MEKHVVIILAEDDDGHAALIKNNLTRAGIENEIIRHKDGEETLDFLFRRGAEPHRMAHTPYILLLDILMPKVDGIETLRQIKGDPELCKIPIIMLTTADNPQDVERCHRLGCSNYIVKPIDYTEFVDAIRKLGFFLEVINVPQINGHTKIEA